MNTLSQRALLLAMPLLIFGAGALVAGVATEAVKRATVAPSTLLDAAERGDDDTIFRLVTAGQDPGAPVVLQRQVFEWRPKDSTSPLLVAIAEGEFDNFTYMMKHAQHLADSPNDQALCVAAGFGRREIVRFLIERGTPAVPRNGCNGSRPEDLAAERGFDVLANELRQYRLKTQ